MSHGALHAIYGKNKAKNLHVHGEEETEAVQVEAEALLIPLSPSVFAELQKMLDSLKMSELKEISA